MAIKKPTSKDKIDDFNLDDELDIGSFDIGSVDDAVDSAAKKKGRSPISKVFKGTMSGILDTATDKEFLKKFVMNALPREYGEVVDTISTITESTSRLYDDAVKEVKPSLRNINNQVNKLIPDKYKRSKMLMDKITAALGEERGTLYRESKEEELQSNLASIFAANAEVDAARHDEDKAESRIRDTIAGDRFKTSFDVLNTISMNIGRLSNYNDKITSAYQKKSIELQYRSYFVQDELLNTSKKFFEIFRLQNEAITKNTALPDYVKLTKSEQFMDISKRRFMENIRDSLFGNGNFIRNGISNLKERVLDKARDISRAFEEGAMGIEQIRSSGEMLSGYKDLGIEAPDKYAIGGNILGGTILDELAASAGYKIRNKLANHPVGKYGFKLANVTRNLPQHISELAHSNKLDEDYFDTSMKGSIKNVAKSAIRTILESFVNRKDITLQKGTGIGDISSPAIFDNRTKTSIDTIIPGFLSRIFRELQILRTGNDKIELTEFDHIKNKFNTQSNIETNVKNKIISSINDQGYDYRFNSLYSKLTGNQRLSPEAETALKDMIKKMAVENSVFDMRKLNSPAALDKLPPNVAKEINDLIQGHITGGNLEQNQYEITNMLNSLRESVGDARGDIQALYNAGYGDILERIGIIKKYYSNGLYLNMDKYKSMLGASTETEKPSVEHTSGRPAEPIKPVVSDTVSIPKFAPDNHLTKEFTESIAKLDESISKLDSSRSEQYIKDIRDNTSYIRTDIRHILDLIKNYKPSKVASETSKAPTADDTPNSILKRLKEMLGGAGGAFTHTLGSISNISKSNIGKLAFGMKILRKPIEIITQSMLKQSFGLVGTTFNIASSILGSVIKNNPLSAIKHGMNIYRHVKDIFKNINDTPVDVYVSGETTPRLKAIMINLGVYIDQLTGKIIKKMSDITGPVLNNKGEIVLDITDIQKGIFDQYGAPIKLKLSSMMDNLIRMGIAGYKRLKGVIYKGMVIGKSLVSTAKEHIGNLFKHTTSEVSAAGSIRDRSELSVLIQIRNILLDRLPRRGKSKSSKSTKSEPVETPAAKTESLFEKFKHIFIRPHQFNDRDESGKREGSWEDILARRSESKKKATVNKADTDQKMRYRSGQNVIDTIMEKAGQAFGLVKDGLGFLADLLSAGSTGKIGSIAKSGKLSKLGKIGSKLAGYGSKAVGMLGSAGRLAEVGGLVKDAALAGGAIMGGTTAGTILGGLGAVGTAIAGILTSPVALGIGAVALAGYGAYKGYKYLTRNRASKLTKMRMAQYGIDQDHQDHYHYIYALEDYLQKDVLGFKSGRAYLIQHNLDVEHIFEIFGISTEDERMSNRLLQWINDRFKPVYLTHQTALYNINNKIKLSDIDDLPPDQKLRYISAAAYNEGPYYVSSSPFSDIDVLDTNQSTITNAIDDARDDVKITVGDRTITGKAITKEADLTNQSIKEVIDAKLADNKARTIKSNFMLDRLSKTAFNLSTPLEPVIKTIKLGMTLAVKIADWFGHDVSALEAVRFKTYGLKEMDRSKVSDIRNLERYMQDYITIGSNKTAVFTGDVKDIIRDQGKNFDISGLNDPRTDSWIQWFRERFLPVYLSYVGMGYQYTGKKSPSEIESLLKESQKLDIANKLSGTPDVWDRLNRPWANYALNTDPKSVSDNISFLESSSKKDIAAEQSLSTVKTNTPVNAKLDTSKYYSNEIPASKQTYDNRLITPTEEETPKSVGIDAANKEIASESKLGTMSQKIALADGPVSDGSNADQYIKLGTGVDISGVNPALWKNFRGMAQEYGIKTGQSVIVTSAYRSRAKQDALHKQFPGSTAAPGRSLHEFGLALDVDSKTLDKMDELGLMRKYGFTRPVGGETWHTEPAGIEVNLQKAKDDIRFATQAIEASPGRGGGGYGSIPGTPTAKRDSKLAMDILNPEYSIPIKTPEKNQILEKITDTAPIKGAVETITPEYKPTKGISVGSKSPMVATTLGGNQIPPSVSTPANDNTYRQAMSNVDIESKPTNISTTPLKSSTPTTVASGINNTPTAPVVVGKQPANKQEVLGIIDEAAKKTGVDPNLMKSFAAVESGLNPNAKASTSSATGLFQFIRDTWNTQINKYARKYGIPVDTPPTDAMANALMGGEFIKSNINILKSVKPDPNATDVYLAHFLGPEGATRFLRSNPSQPAAVVMPKQAIANKSIFFEGNRPRTFSEVYHVLGDRVRKLAAQFGIVAPTEGGLTDTRNADVPSDTGTMPEFGNTVSTNIASTTTAPPVSTNTTAPPVSTNIATKTAPSVPTSDIAPTPGLTTVGYDSTPNTLGALSQKPSGNYMDMGNIRAIPKDTGAGLGIGSNADTMNTISITLSKSLDVQTQVLEVLRSIMDHVSPEKMNNITNSIKDAIASNTTAPTTTQTSSTVEALKAPEAVISLKRVI